ncbi:unnamed protein product [Merluccius merluccius]
MGSAVTMEKGGQCQLGTELLSWGSGELGQTGHGRPGGAVCIGEARLGQFAQGCMGKVKLLACGSSHSVVATGFTAYISSSCSRQRVACRFALCPGNTLPHSCVSLDAMLLMPC